MTARAGLDATDLADRRPVLVVPDSAVGGKAAHYQRKSHLPQYRFINNCHQIFPCLRGSSPGSTYSSPSGPIAGNGFHSMSSGRTALKTAWPGWWGRTILIIVAKRDIKIDDNG